MSGLLDLPLSRDLQWMPPACLNLNNSNETVCCQGYKFHQNKARERLDRVAITSLLGLGVAFFK